MAGVHTFESEGRSVIALGDWPDRLEEGVTQSGESREPPERLVWSTGAGGPFSGGRLDSEPFRPDAQRSPDKGVKGEDHCGQKPDANRDPRVVPNKPRVGDERSKPRHLVRLPEGREGLTRDEEEPSVGPGQD